MVILYLNSKGEEKLIDGVMNLQKAGDGLFTALVESGTELKLRVAGIKGVYRNKAEAPEIPAKEPEITEKDRETGDRAKAEAYTDGACKGNPGPGGWGVIVVSEGHEVELSGGEPATTNNKMELSAVIAALGYFQEPTDITLTTDSRYIVDAIQKGWLNNWKKNGWRKADKGSVANVELWEKLLVLLEKHHVTFVWIKGHAGHAYNERCDKLAVKQSLRYAHA